MSWHCSRALVAEFSEGICLDGGASVPSNTTLTPEAYYWPDKTTEHSRLSRFGMMSEPLTAGRGEELLMWYRAGSRAKTLVAREQATDSMESEADCGQKWRGLLAKYDHATHSLKTAQCSLLEDLIESSVTLPRWGSMRNGGLYLRRIPALHTAEKEFGSWPTPNCIGFRSDGELKLLAKMASNHAEYLAMSDRACNSKRQRHYPTATATAYKGWSPNHNRANTDDRLDYTIEREAAAEGLTGRLNPEWVEWLMGWPIGLTALKPLETAKFREWQQQHSLNWQADLSEAA